VTVEATALLEDARAGDARAFILLLEPLLPAAKRLAHAMLRGGPDVEDVVQEAALKAWRHIGRFRYGSDLEPWFLTIVANQCRSHLRGRWQQVVKLPWIGDAAAEEDQPTADVTDLKRALERLSHDQRLLLVLRYYLDYSFAQMAAFLGTSEKAAKSRTHRALQRLRTEIPEVLDDA
jgi:RNA polymerase sigma-70 factor, ECF subfamily